MKEIVSLVPGFSVALARLPGTLGAYADLVASLDRGTLSPRSRLEIGLIVANRVRCDYCKWVMERLASNEGMREEDIFFAGMGISRGRREAAIAKLAQMMVAGTPLDPSAATNARACPKSPELRSQTPAPAARESQRSPKPQRRRRRYPAHVAK